MVKTYKNGKLKCSDCGKLALENMTLCQKHLESRRERNKNKRSKRKEAGLCTECGVNKPMEEYKKCQECHNKIESVRLIRTNNRKQTNHCTKCNRDKSNIVPWFNNYCAYCHLKEKFNLDCTTKDQAEQIINDLLVKQNYRCALSGRDLRTNKYHIDHIVPRSTRDDLLSDPSNWQLIVEEANYFKKDKTTEELILIARDITKEAIKNGKLNYSDLQENICQQTIVSTIIKQNVSK